MISTGNFILKSLSQHEKVIPGGNGPCVSLPKGLGFSQVRELAQKCRGCRDKQQGNYFLRLFQNKEKAQYRLRKIDTGKELLQGILRRSVE